MNDMDTKSEGMLHAPNSNMEEREEHSAVHDRSADGASPRAVQSVGIRTFRHHYTWPSLDNIPRGICAKLFTSRRVLRDV